MEFSKAFIKLKQGKAIKINESGNNLYYQIKENKLVMSDGNQVKDAIFTGVMLLDNRWIAENN